MKAKKAASRKPVLFLAIALFVGSGLLITGVKANLKDSQMAHSSQVPVTQSKPILSTVLAEESTAIDVHAYGYELIRRGQWDDARSILEDGCNGGDLTSCLVLGDEYIIRGQPSDAESVFLAACQGGQLPGCRALLDHSAVSQSSQAYAFENLAERCRESDDAVACALLANSRWGQADEGRARTFLGLACSRGDETSCARLGGS